MTRRAGSIVLFVLILSLAGSLQARLPTPGKNKLNIRGQPQEIYFYPAAGAEPHAKVLFAPGDGGWRGFATTIAENLVSAGYEVYGLDTRRYLQTFTDHPVLTTSEVGSDFGEIARWVRQGGNERVRLIGWSEGAGLGLVATADPANRALFEGMVAIGTPDACILAWHWADIAAELTKSMPNEPTFKSADFIARVSPLPLFLIASTHDEYVSLETTRALFAAAHEPKRLVVIDANNHKYEGKTDEFFRALREGLNWIQQHR
jgi:pimeloyl-ACP methyl ester carboxylesterase